MAMPRLLVDPEFAAAAIVPLSQFSDDITFVQGKLTAFDGKVGTVETSEGEVTLTSDISVLATGSRYANSVTRAQSGSARDRIAEFKRHNANLQSAKRVLILSLIHI